MQMTDARWFEADRLADGITRIREPGLGPLHAANLWLVEGRDRALLIDAGVGVAPLRPVVEALTARPVTCLVTHAHYDHMGGAWEFADRRAHALEAAILADPKPGKTLWQGWLTDAAFLRLPSENFRIADYGLKPAPPTALVEDGFTIDLGERRLEILHVPGHAPGLLAVHDVTQNILFTSDALYAGRMFFDLPRSDPSAAARSVDRLARRGARLLHPGHGDSFGGADLPDIAEAALNMIASVRHP
jgi:glyoxylase-like metal-dependent hydrolase (beta-lactamase superfamily II)